MTTQTFNRKQWIYRRVPDGRVGPEHYELQVADWSPGLAPGEVLVQASAWSVDPYMRINQSRKPTFNEQPHPLDTVQGAGAVGQVLASRAAGFVVGDWVEGVIGWQTHAAMHVTALRKLDPTIDPHTALGVLGMPGRTAWFGLMEAGEPKAGEVVVVSAAAGAVGSLVAQFAKRQGCIVVGIAGSDEKCVWLKQTLGCDYAFNYRNYESMQTPSEALAQAMKAAVRGVDVYFDNVGGWISDAVIPLVNRRARIVICGVMSQYDGQLDEPSLGPRFLHHFLYQRCRMQGILARDYMHRMDEMLRIVAPWVRQGSVHFEQTVVQGFEVLPQTLGDLFEGKYRGKVLVTN
jgi:NADPH-dependent curcumin reductase CurA